MTVLSGEVQSSQFGEQTSCYAEVFNEQGDVLVIQRIEKGSAFVVSLFPPNVLQIGEGGFSGSLMYVEGYQPRVIGTAFGGEPIEAAGFYFSKTIMLGGQEPRKQWEKVVTWCQALSDAMNETVHLPDEGRRALIGWAYQLTYTYYAEVGGEIRLPPGQFGHWVEPQHKLFMEILESLIFEVDKIDTEHGGVMPEDYVVRPVSEDLREQIMLGVLQFGLVQYYSFLQASAAA